MHRETSSSGYAVIVHNAQGAKLNVLGVVVIGEGKRKAGVEPTMVGVAAVAAVANVDNRETLLTR